MKQKILVAGATGNLGMRICRELLQKGADVTALVRMSARPDKKNALTEMGVSIAEVNLDIVADIAKACAGAGCVVSALAGLRDVIVDLQKRILDGAVQAGVPRFIPSDFCTDYNDLVPGSNRNFDLRRECKAFVDAAPIRASSVFNGAFADVLMYNTPVLNQKDKSIGYWGDKKDWKLDFTTMDNTAAFTAAVALDNEAPRDLQIASFQVSPEDIQADVKSVSGQEFAIRGMGSLEGFAQYLKQQRAENPAGEHELYANWQQGQYMYSMFSTHHKELANQRYAGINWTGSRDFIGSFVR